jgi:hypothetical protein
VTAARSVVYVIHDGRGGEPILRRRGIDVRLTEGVDRREIA